MTLPICSHMTHSIVSNMPPSIGSNMPPSIGSTMPLHIGSDMSPPDFLVGSEPFEYQYAYCYSNFYGQMLPLLCFLTVTGTVPVHGQMLPCLLTVTGIAYRFMGNCYHCWQEIFPDDIYGGMVPRIHVGYRYLRWYQGFMSVTGIYGGTKDLCRLPVIFRIYRTLLTNDISNFVTTGNLLITV